MLGKKLNSRTRKAVEDYCARSRLPPHAGRRTFDNVKRITRRVEDLGGDMAEHITRIYMMPQEMATQYANVLFINELRLDTSKKKLQYLKLADYEYVASVMSRLWTPSADSGSSSNLDLAWGALDPVITQDCREMKNLFNSFKGDVFDELRGRVGAAMTAAWAAAQVAGQPAKPPAGSASTTPPLTASPSAAQISVAEGAAPAPAPAVYPAALVLERSGTTMLDPKSGPNFFRAMIKSALSIGIGLGSAKELRELPINVLERIVEPCVAVGWTPADADCFFACLRDALAQSAAVPQQARHRFARTWPRLLDGIRLIAGRMRQPVSAVGGATSPSVASIRAASVPAMGAPPNTPAGKTGRSIFESTTSFTKAILDRVTKGSDSSI
ncbi:acidic fibroblast growth factor binding-domain-containing protein, partial [Hyaloraphidium curvatum]